MKTSRYYALEQSPLYKMPSKSKLADLLLVTRKDLKFLSEADNLYSHFPVPKRDGTQRIVDNPCDQLKRIQRRIASLIGRIAPPHALFCPVKGRSYVDNAAHHRAGRVVHCLDIQTYYPSSPRRRVYWFFHTIMKCPKDVSAILSGLACCNGSLATGSPASPVLAYYTHMATWERVATTVKTAGCSLSIYIDDVTISGAKVPKRLVWQVKEIIHGGGLRYHKEKRSVDRPCEVTGVVLRGGQLAAPNRQHRKLCEAKRAKSRATDPATAAKFESTLVGLKGQMGQINNANAHVLAEVRYDPE